MDRKSQCYKYNGSITNEKKQHVNDTLKSMEKKQSIKNIFDAWKVVWKLCCMNFLQFAITFSVYPNFVFDLNLGTTAPWRFPLIVLIYSCMDFIGKLINTYMQMREGMLFWIICYTRIVFVPLFMLTHFYKNNPVLSSIYFGIGLQLLMAFSNGVCVSACFSIASEKGIKEIRMVTGYLMVASMFFGITFGCIWPIIISNLE